MAFQRPVKGLGRNSTRLSCDVRGCFQVIRVVLGFRVFRGLGFRV